MVDLGNAFTGAATGAGVGSAFGPAGTVAGGIVGGVSGAFGFGKDKPNELKERQKYSPEQQALIEEAAQAAREGNQDAIEWLRSLFGDDPEAWEAFEAPAIEQFNEEIVPNILGRLNAGNSRGSSALNNSLAQGAAKLSTNLAQQRAELRGRAVGMLQDYSRIGLTEKTQPYIQEGSKGAFSKLGPTAGQGYDYAVQDYRANRGK